MKERKLKKYLIESKTQNILAPGPHTSAGGSLGSGLGAILGFLIAGPLSAGILGGIGAFIGGVIGGLIDQTTQELNKGTEKTRP